jgi:peptidoglycan/LPS O-acetylase OafA/YrhL
MQQTDRFTTLDALRGLAAVCVMLFHLRGSAPVTVASGYLAVDLFFGISGFVIAHTYEARLQAGLGLRAFAFRRLVRLYPMALLGALLGVVLHGGGANSLLLVPSFASSRSLYPSNPVMWSLLFELIVNGLFAVLSVKLGGKSLVAVIGLCALVFGYGIIRSGSASELGAQWALVGYGLFRSGFSFSVGVAFSRAHHRLGLIPRQKRRAWLLPMAAVGILALQPTHQVAWELVTVFMVLPGLLWLSTLWQLAAPRLASWLGGISYPLYCIHLPLISWLGPQARGLVVTYLAVIALAWALDRWVDPAARAWLELRLARRVRPAWA